jgi:hypothetical protein
MKKLLVGLSLVLLASVAAAQQRPFVPESVVPERVVPLGQFAPHIRIPNCSVATGQSSTWCEYSFAENGIIGPRVVQEIQVHPIPPAEPSAAQCWIRVQFSENGIDRVEVAKFSWPAADLHSINYALPVAIGVVGGPDTVMRVQVGGSGGEDCGAEVKVYTRDNLHSK